MRHKINPIILASEKTPFPEPNEFDKQGLVAIGGSLSPQRIIEAYRHGIFPWYEPGQPIVWWSPDPRMILYPHEFKITRSLKKSIKKVSRFTIDAAFSDVILACASFNNRANQTWITPEMIEAYTHLHQLGYAHSLEVWKNEDLIGGLYGLSFGHAFFGESMFHTERDGSKMALYYLCQTCLNWGFDFIDCQLPTSHLQSLGGITVPRRQFLKLLEATLKHKDKKGNWTTQGFR